jgi:hypothetical protein
MVSIAIKMDKEHKPVSEMAKRRKC